MPVAATAQASTGIQWVTPTQILNLTNPAITSATSVSFANTGVSSSAGSILCEIAIDAVNVTAVALLKAQPTASSTFLQVLARGVDPAPGNIADFSPTSQAWVRITPGQTTFYYSITGPAMGACFSSVNIRIIGYM